MVDSSEPQQDKSDAINTSGDREGSSLADELKATASEVSIAEQSTDIVEGGQESGTEQEASPESVERIAQTMVVLTGLVEQAKEHSHPFRRNIVRPVGDGYWHPVESPQAGLRSIDLRTYTGPDSDEAFHLTLSYDEANPDDMLMLSLESPVTPANPYQFMEAAGAGVIPVCRRFQDFLYSSGADTVPVQEADYSYVYDYRPMGHAARYDATKEYMDTILGLLKNATVVEQAPRGLPNKRIARVDELMPEVSAL